MEDEGKGDSDFGDDFGDLGDLGDFKRMTKELEVDKASDGMGGKLLLDKASVLMDDFWNSETSKVKALFLLRDVGVLLFDLLLWDEGDGDGEEKALGDLLLRLFLFRFHLSCRNVRICSRLSWVDDTPLLLLCWCIGSIKDKGDLTEGLGRVRRDDGEERVWEGEGEARGGGSDFGLFLMGDLDDDEVEEKEVLVFNLSFLTLRKMSLRRLIILLRVWEGLVGFEGLGEVAEAPAPIFGTFVALL